MDDVTGHDLDEVMEKFEAGDNNALFWWFRTHDRMDMSMDISRRFDETDIDIIYRGWQRTVIGFVRITEEFAICVFYDNGEVHLAYRGNDSFLMGEIIRRTEGAAMYRQEFNNPFSSEYY